MEIIHLGYEMALLKKQFFHLELLYINYRQYILYMYYQFYEYINTEWKTTFRAVYETDHESKIHEYEQIDITKIHDNNYYLNKTLLYGIRFAVVSTIVLVSAILVKLI